MDKASEPHERVIWPGEHKNAVRATVTRHGRYCWEVRMSFRSAWTVSVIAPSVPSAWRRCEKAAVFSLHV